MVIRFRYTGLMAVLLGLVAFTCIATADQREGERAEGKAGVGQREGERGRVVEGVREGEKGRPVEGIREGERGRVGEGGQFGGPKEMAASLLKQFDANGDKALSQPELEKALIALHEMLVRQMQAAQGGRGGDGGGPLGGRGGEGGRGGAGAGGEGGRGGEGAGGEGGRGGAGGRGEAPGGQRVPERR